HFGGDDGGAGADERVVDGLAWAAVVLNRPAHALDGFLSRMTGLRFYRLVDLPQRRLSPVALPMSGVTHGIPARLVLDVIVAAANRKVRFGPDDLHPNLKAGSYQRIEVIDLHGTRRVPCVNDIAG